MRQPDARASFIQISFLFIGHDLSRLPKFANQLPIRKFHAPLLGLPHVGIHRICGVVAEMIAEESRSTVLKTALAIAGENLTEWGRFAMIRAPKEGTSPSMQVPRIKEKLEVSNNGRASRCSNFQRRSNDVGWRRS